jgi:uncharacterized membrane protein
MSDWYYAENNEQKGPINESELKANFATTKLPADTLVWKEGMQDWAPANQVPAFSFRAPPTPAKVQPPAVAAAPVATETSAATPATGNPDSTKPLDLATLVGGKGEALEVDAEDAEKNKIFGILAYLIFFVPLVAAKDSPFAKYHANQGLTLFVLSIIVIVIVTVIDATFNLLGLYILDWIVSLLFLPLLGLAVLGILNAAAGKCVPLPVIGGVKMLK